MGSRGRVTYLGQLTLGLPGTGKWVEVAAVQLAGNVARDANTGSSGAGIGHCS